MDNSSRKKRLLFNTGVGITSQILTVLCGFILPSITITAYGSKAYGLTSSINQFLGFIQLCELGVGAVVQSALYKPLAEGNKYQISCILKSSKKFFRIIGAILFGYVILLCLFYPTIVPEFDHSYIALMIVALSINSFANYYLGMNNSLLLQADQKAYIPLGIQTVTLLLNTIISVILIKSGASLLFVKYSTATLYLLRPLVMMLYVERNYDVDYSVHYESEPIQQKWNGLAQHFTSVIVDHTDTVVLTTFSSLENVSIYSVYALVVASLRRLIESSLNGVQAAMGNMLAKGETTELMSFFDATEWIVHTAVTYIYTVTGILIIPFVLLYTKNVNDANYNVPLFSVLIVFANAGFCLQYIYKMIVKVAGHYKQTQTAAVIEAIINVVASVILVFQFGLIGVALGTILAMLYRLIYHVMYMKNNILHRPYTPFIKQVLIDSIVVLCILYSVRYVPVNFESYKTWIVSAFMVSIFSAFVTLSINLIFYYPRVKQMFHKFTYKK